MNWQTLSLKPANVCIFQLLKSLHVKNWKPFDFGRGWGKYTAFTNFFFIRMFFGGSHISATWDNNKMWLKYWHVKYVKFHSFSVFLAQSRCLFEWLINMWNSLSTELKIKLIWDWESVTEFDGIFFVSLFANYSSRDVLYVF